MSTRWVPLLIGRDAARAWEAIEAIAADLDRELPDVSLAMGHAGIALFYAYLARSSGRPDPRAGRHLDLAIDALQHEELDASLYSGFVGVAWTAEHLRGAENNAQNQAVDAALVELLADGDWYPPYDLIAGLTGMGVYALERGRSGTLCLTRVLSGLERVAERHQGRTTWRAALDLLADQQLASSRGYYNLGVAHGVGGVMAFLAFAVQAGANAQALLDETKHWIGAFRAQSGSPRYPCLIDVEDLRGRQLRSAWCHGDPGLAAAWLSAARATGDAAWERQALEMARGFAGRSEKELGVTDAGLCHGAAGLGHLLNRLHHASQEPIFADAAMHWFVRALDLRRPGSGTGGFLAAGLDQKGGPSWDSEPGLLVGAAGVGLALLGAVSTIAPSWDRVLLVSSRG